MEFFAGTHGALGVAQTATWPCEPIILSIGPFESPAE